jgi:hypothetical protein
MHHPTRFTARITALLTMLALLALAVPTAAVGADSRLRWHTPGDRVRFDNGWTLTTTHSPMIEVRKPRGGGVIGVVELLSYPLDNRLAAATTAAAKERVLRAYIAEHHEAIAADRREGLGPDYRYTPGATTTIRFGKTPAVRYGAVTRNPEGEVVERHRGYAALKRGQLWIFVANGYDPNLFPSEIAQLTPERQAVLARYLDGLVKASPLPRAGDGIIEGIIAGTEGGLDGGRLWLLHNGRKQRIAQPRPMTVEAASKYRRGPRIALVDVQRSETGSFFAVVPPDGPKARLQLVVGRTIHEVVVQHIREQHMDGVEHLRRNVLDQLVVARG